MALPDRVSRCDFRNLPGGNDRARKLAFQVVLESLPDETWLSTPVLKSIKIRTLEYRSYINERKETTDPSDSGPSA